MEKEVFEKLSNDFFEELFKKDYIPNTVESYESFIKRKKLAFAEDAEKQIEPVLKGIFIFSILSQNERIKNLLTKFISLSNLSNVNVEGDGQEKISQNLLEHNLFGLEETDGDELLQLANYAEKMEMFEEAGWMFQSITVIFPERLEGWLRWGTTESQHFFDYQKVLKIYSHCLQLFDHPLVHLSIGVCHVKGNDFTSAKEQFQYCIDICDQFEETELKIQATELLNELDNLAVNHY